MTENEREAFEERAAILEFQAGFQRGRPIQPAGHVII